MPNWKKVIVSGSNAVVNNITGSGHLNILNNGFTVNIHDSTELEVAGNISASNNGNISAKDLAGYGNLTIGNSGTIGNNLTIDNRLAVGTTNTTHASFTIASGPTPEHGILMVRAVDGGVTASGILGAIGFDSTGSDSANFAGFSSIASHLFKAPSYIAGMAAEFQDEDNKGGHLVFGTKAINTTDGGTTPERMRITSAGRVGIGDTDPNQLLTIKGTNPQISIEESDTEFLRLGVTSTGHDMCIGWDDSDDLHLGCFSSPTDASIETKMLIKSTGRVGIGETTPDHMLHIKGENGDANTRNPQICIEESSTEFVRLGVEATTGDMCLGCDHEDDFHFGHFTSTIDSTIDTKMIMQGTTGNVGIGTTDPDRLFQVKGSKSNTHMVRIQNTSGTNPDGILVRCDKNVNTSKYLQFQRNGGVTIGSIAGNGANGINYNQTSDERLKSNIRDCEITIDSLDEIRMRSFTMGTDRVLHGVIAQELLSSSFSEFVTTEDEYNTTHNLSEGDEGYEYMSVAYNAFIPALIKSVQDANRLIKAQQTTIDQLEARIQALES